MTKDTDVAKLWSELQVARKPWNVENYQGMRRGLTAMHKINDGRTLMGTHIVDIEMFSVGSSNLLTLAAAGRTFDRLQDREKLMIQKAAASVVWLELDHGWAWEAATLVRPEELARMLEKQPTVPKGTWTALAILMLK